MVDISFLIDALNKINAEGGLVGPPGPQGPPGESGAAVSHTHTPTQVGLGAADNTSDLNKPVSNAADARMDGMDSAIATKRAEFIRTWNGTTWSARPTGAGTNVPAVAYSTHDILCVTGPPSPQLGDVWEPHPLAAL